jgi:uncharacterized protein (DUF1800 family)
MAFGPTVFDIDRLSKLGRTAFVDDQLQAGQPDPLHLEARTRHLEVNQFQPADLEDWPEEHIIFQLQQDALLRAIYSPNQLLERMVDLWTNHFNIYARKGYAMYRLGKDQRDVIRTHALGKFSNLLKASAHSPAMLAYLDNTVNRKGVANENYARELMELHSLGVHGGYSQRDVQEVARCFTGWGIEKRFLRPRGQFRFDPDLHDDGEKLVLGVKIPAGGGARDGDRVLEILAAHASCSQFISGKICRYFLGTTDTPWHDKLTTIYQATGGDIRAMLRPLLLSDSIVSGPALVKRPYDFVVSALRSVNADTDAGKGLQTHLEKMGQPLHQWPMPDGYPDKTAAWTGSLLARWNFALALSSNSIPGTRVRAEELEHLLPTGGEPANAARLAKLATSREESAALSLMSPEFQWR